MRTALLVLALVLLAAAPVSAATPVGPGPGVNREQALVERLTVERANALAANDARWSAQYAQRARRLEAAERLLRASQTAVQTARAELDRLAAEKKALADEIAARDQAYALEIAAYRQLMSGVVANASPEKLAALERYASGDRVGAFPVLMQITQAENEARAKAAAAIAAEADMQARRANADNLRALGAQALDMIGRGEARVEAALPIWQEAARLDPSHGWTWVEVSRLQAQAGLLRESRQSAEAGLAATSDVSTQIALFAQVAEAAARLNELPAAREAADKAVALGRGLVQSEGTPAAKVWLIRTMLNLESIQTRQDDREAALRTLGEAIRIAEAGGFQNDDEDVRYMKASIWSGIGVHLSTQGQFAEAERSFRSALALIEQNHAARPTTFTRNAMAWTRSRIGMALVDRGDLVEGRSYLSRATDELTSLAAADAGNRALQLDLAVLLLRMTALEIEEERWPQARELIERAMPISEAVVAANSSDVLGRSLLVFALDRQAVVLRHSGDLPGSSAAVVRALEIVRALVAAEPENLDVRDQAASLLWRSAENAVAANNLDLAERLYRTGLAQLMNIAGRRPRVRTHLAECVEMARELAELQARKGDQPGARRSYEISITIAADIAGRDPHAPAQRALARSLFAVARDVGGEGAWAKALAQYEKLAALGPLRPADVAARAEARVRAAAGQPQL